MANELNLSLGQTGQSITASILLAGTVVQSGISCSEVAGAAGYYTGNMPVVSAGYYDVQFYQSGQIIASGNIAWNGTSEIQPVTLNSNDASILTAIGGIPTPPTAASIATTVWADLTTGTDFGTTNSIGKLLAGYTAPPTVGAIQSGLATSANVTAAQAAIIVAMPTPPTAASIATTVWADLTTGSDFSTTNSIGKLLASYTSPPTVNAIQSGLATSANVTAAQTAIIAATTASPSAATIATAVWQDVTTSGDFSNNNSIGKLLAGYVSPPSVMAIQSGLATSANVTSAQSSILAAIPTPPAPTTIATALLTDAFSGSDFGIAGSLGAMLKSLSSKLPTNAIADQASVLNAIGSPLQSGGNVTVGGYASGQDPMSLLFTTSNKLQVNADHTAAATIGDSVEIQNNITIPAAIAQASQTPGQITIVRGDTLSVALPTLGNISSRTKLTFTVKLSSTTLSTANTDCQAILQVIEGLGLTILNGAVTSTTAYGSLMCTNPTTGAVVLVLAPDATSQLPVEDLVWDCQWIGPTGVSTPVAGTFSIVPDVTQSIT